MAKRPGGRRLDAVRLPIGYWTLEERAPCFSGARRVDNAMKWVQTHDLQVLIDLHGAPGSQNGFDHSGHSGPLNWTQPENIEATIVKHRSHDCRAGNHRAALQPQNAAIAIARLRLGAKAR